LQGLRGEFLGPRLDPLEIAQEQRTRLAPSVSGASRTLLIVTTLPTSERAAVAPSATVSGGLINSRSCSSHQRQAVISPASGLLWMRLLPRWTNLKCLTALVTYTVERSIPAFSSAASKIAPAGPTKGRPARSSWSPGCSPMNTIDASSGPSPKTVCVACLYRSHRVHTRASLKIASQVLRTLLPGSIRRSASSASFSPSNTMSAMAVKRATDTDVADGVGCF
jgi:hypothetical protein